MHKMIFGCFAPSRVDAARALLLAESIRTFAGQYSNLPFLIMRPVGGEQLTKTQYKSIELLDVELHSFELEPAAASFPFAGKVVASAAAEALSDERSSQLVWMDYGTLVVNPVDLLLLMQGIRLGYRPVDHLLIGSSFDKPVDPFWAYIFQACGVTSEDIYPMVTSTDQVKMRPYINAGMLVVRPEDQLFQSWRDTFLEIYQDRRSLEFYEVQPLYRIFIHQAVLAGCVIAGYQPSETVQLPPEVNYPLHMHTQYPSRLQPSTLNQLVSFRYEGYFSKPGWRQLLQVDPPLKDWLEERENLLSRR